MKTTVLLLDLGMGQQTSLAIEAANRNDDTLHFFGVVLRQAEQRETLFTGNFMAVYF